MAKTCLNDDRPVFALQFCKWCWAKEHGKPIKKAIIKPKRYNCSKIVKNNSKVLKRNIDKYSLWGFDSEKEMFEHIWNTMPHISFLSGDKLVDKDSPFYYNQFAHVLSKAQNKYYKFKLNPKNIVMLTAREHLAYDFGTEIQRERLAEEKGFSWSKITLLQEELKLEYQQLKQ